MSRENVATTRGSITPLVIEAFNRGGVEEAPSKSWRPPATASGRTSPCSLRPRGLGSGNQDPAEGRSDGKARVE
jgi:hypothetical protein